MSTISVNFFTPVGSVKPMHCVNNGPMRISSNGRNNFDAYKALQIPYARNHDAAFCASYGGEHTVDIHMIFPDFTADPENPAAYDFTVTDDYIQRTLDAGTETFYRLGAKIEHTVKKYGTIPPADFAKWAVICEHVIRHMNEGWADGHHFGIEYWEIWNEPDLDPDDSANKRTWGGTEAQFFDFYAIAACHLKACFPDLKIGGPALAHDLGWAERFLAHMQTRQVPIDFFSWHIYTANPDKLAAKCETVRTLLDKYGYSAAESILNEWNYVIDWKDRFLESVKAVVGMRGAAFTASCMLAAHATSLDMLMYYDARPTIYNGMFDFYTQAPLKGYYPFLMFSQLYALGQSVAAKSDDGDIRVLAAANGEKGAVMLTYSVGVDLPAAPRMVTVEGLCGESVKVALLDETHTMDTREMTVVDGRIALTLAPDSVVLITGAAI